MDFHANYTRKNTIFFMMTIFNVLLIFNIQLSCNILTKPQDLVSTMLSGASEI